MLLRRYIVVKGMIALKKKIFFCSIPMLPPEALRKIKYRKETNGELYSDPSRFPSIVMIDGCFLGEEEVKIIAVKTDDDNGRTAANFKLFEQELKELAEKYEALLKIDSVIILPHDEGRDKQIALFKQLAKEFEDGCEIYMDVTYGTKITSIGMFASLVYAEKVKKCDIKQIVYGKYPHDGGEIGDFFDVSSMYDLAMLINSAEHLPQNNIDGLLKLFGG